jgi:hypothetical protein
MLTPAEELGLGGLRLADRVHAAFAQIPERELVRVLRRLRAEAHRRHLVYLRDGRPDAIRVLPYPLAALPEQLAYVHYVSQTILNALKRLPDLYAQDPALREVLRLSEDEERWLRECWGSSQGESNPVFGRLDAVVDFTSPEWKDSLRFVEPNLSGIGGLHLAPTAERIVADVVLPSLRRHDARLPLEVGTDIRDLLMQEALDHAESLGRRLENLCFVEPKYAGSGPDEQEELARFYHDRYGMRLLHADPRELTLQGGEVYYDGARVDLAYRDYAVCDLLDLQREGADVAPMRALFRQNRMISSIAAELDQKSCWEVLTDARFTHTYFTADERQVFRHHIPWTRLVSDRRTDLPHGEAGDLLDYVRRQREALVLKPNRSYGGDGVRIGPGMTQAEWESALDAAVADRERWVVQELVRIPVQDFAVLGPDGRVRAEPFYTVMGFVPSPYGLAILGRASQKQVVNVAQRGGLCVVMTGHAAPAVGHRGTVAPRAATLEPGRARPDMARHAESAALALAGGFLEEGLGV